MTERKSPLQAVYDWTFKVASQLADTYDHLPLKNENAAYPFINLGETVITPAHTKSDVGGTISQTLDVWGDATMKLTVSEIADEMVASANDTVIAYGYRISGQQWHHTVQTMQDTSVPNTVLNRAQVTLIFELM